jgi:hypothetical protein
MAEKTDEEFIRHWSARAFDESQLAQIAEIEKHLIKYAMEGWRSMSIIPPVNTPLIGACDNGLVLMIWNDMGDWRTLHGHPHKPPRAWMPAPIPPKVNGKGA